MSVIQFCKPYAITNAVIDPSFEVWTNSSTPTYWTTSGAGSVLQVTDPVLDGQYAVKVTGAKTLTQTIVGLTPYTTYCFSLYVWLVKLGSGATISAENTSTAALVSSNNFDATRVGKWTRAQVVYTTDATGSCILLITGLAGSVFYLDCAQLEILDTANPLVNPGLEQYAAGVAYGWTTASGTTQSTSTVHSGYSSARVTGSANNIQQIATGLSTGVSYIMSVWVNVTGSAVVTFTDTGAYANNAVTVTSAGWQQVTYTRTCLDGSLGINVSITGGDNTSIVYVDDASILPVYNFSSELASSWCSGDMDDCSWSANANTSTSARPGWTRKGGAWIDPGNLGGANQGARPKHWAGMGRPESDDILQEYSLLHGGKYQRSRYKPRACSIQFNFAPSSLDDYHAKLNLLDLLLSSTYTTNPQPVLMRYQGSTREIVLPVIATKNALSSVVEGGKFQEYVELPMVAPDPFWRTATGNTKKNVFSNTNMAINAVVQRINGVWGNMANGILKSTAPTTPSVTAIIQDGKGTAYILGNFTDAGSSSVTGLGGVVSWNIAAGTYKKWGTGTDNTGPACGALSPDGLFLYGAGTFTNANGVLCNNIFKLNLTTGVYTGIGGATKGTDGSIYAMAFDSNGKLHIGGSFAHAGGVSTPGVAIYNPANDTFSAVGTGIPLGINNIIFVLLLLPNNKMLVGGNFATFNSVTCNHVAIYDTTAFTVTILGTTGAEGLRNTTAAQPYVYTACVAPNGNISLGGNFNFQTGGTLSLLNVCQWNNQQFLQLGSGLGPDATAQNTVNAMVYDNAGKLYATGYMVNTPTLNVFDGYSWKVADLAIPANTVIGNALSAYGGNLFMGIGGSVTTTAVGISTTFTPKSTVWAYPTLQITGPGTLVLIRNSTTGVNIYFNNYPLQSGEIVTLSLSPDSRAITSSWRGSIPWALTTASNLSNFILIPGQPNTITAYLTGATGATTVTMQWREVFLDIHGAAIP